MGLGIGRSVVDVPDLGRIIGDLIPSTNNVFDIGSLSNRFRNVRIGTDLEAGGNCRVEGTTRCVGKLTCENDLLVGGDLTVQGMTTTIESQTLVVEDKNIEMGGVITPTDLTADGGGIILKGTIDKTILWNNASDAWIFNQQIETSQIKLTGGSPGANKVLTSDAAGLATWETPAVGANGWVDDGTVVRLATGSDSVGIGTSTPQGTLQVSGPGGVVVGGFPSGALHITSTVAGVNSNAAITGHNIFGGNKQLWYLGSASSGNDAILFINRQIGSLSLITSGNSDILLTPNGTGKVGIGVTPTAKLDVNGDVNVSGTLTADQVDANNLRLDLNTMSVTNLNGDLILDASTAGTGVVKVTDQLKIEGSTSQLLLNDTDNDKTYILKSNLGDFSIVEIGGNNVFKIKSGAADNSIEINLNQVKVGTRLVVDNLRLDGNTISSTDLNGTIIIAPNGTGAILLTADRVLTLGSSPAATGDNSELVEIRDDRVTTGSAPNYVLAVNQQNGPASVLFLGNDGNGDAVIVTGDNDLRIGNDVAGAFTENMRIESGGKVIAQAGLQVIGDLTNFGLNGDIDSFAAGTGALGSTTTGADNVAVGVGALNAMTSGLQNVAIGHLALNLATNTKSNVAVGANALGVDTVGDFNVAIGHDALKSLTVSDDNIAIGFAALQNLTTGIDNIGIGCLVGQGIVTGSRNILLGEEANFATDVSDMLNIGNTIFANLGLSGNVGIGISAPDASAKLDLSSITQGFLPPRMTTAEIDAIVSPAIGLEGYDTTINKKKVFTGAEFKILLTEDVATVLVQETFASTNVRFFGELALPAGQGWTDVVTTIATIDLVTETVFGVVKQVVRHNDDSNGSTTSEIVLTAQNWTDINAFGASYGGTSRLDTVEGVSGFFSGLQANSAENPLATGNRRYGVVFDTDGANLRLKEADLAPIITMDGTGGNPLIPFDEWFSWEVVIPAGLGAAEFYINGILTTFAPTFTTNTGGLGTAIKVGSGSSSGTNRIVFHDNFGVTIYEEAATKTLAAATMAGDVAQINIPEGKRDYTIILPDGNPRPIGTVLRLVANNLLGVISLENQNPAAPEILYNGLRTLAINVAVKEIIEGINTVSSGNVYIGFQTDQTTSHLDEFDANDATFPAVAPAVANSRNAHPIIAFNDTVAQNVVFHDVMSRDYLGGNVLVDIDWVAATATSGGVTWGVEFERVIPGGQDIDFDGFATQKTATGTANGTSGIVTRTTITLTQAEADAIAAGDSHRLRLERVTTDGGDIMIGDAQVLSVIVRQ